MSSDPSIEILGIYRVDVDDEEYLWNSLRSLYLKSGTYEEPLVQEYFACVTLLALVECRLSRLEERFQLADFGQDMPLQPREARQAAYQERLLDPAGNEILHEFPLPRFHEGRLVFFLHYFDSRQPLHSSYGILQCPAVTEMPDRLRRIVHYEPPG